MNLHSVIEPDSRSLSNRRKFRTVSFRLANLVEETHRDGTESLTRNDSDEEFEAKLSIKHNGNESPEGRTNLRTLRKSLSRSSPRTTDAKKREDGD
jgi:hypothetical protein